MFHPSLRRVLAGAVVSALAVALPQAAAATEPSPASTPDQAPASETGTGTGTSDETLDEVAATAGHRIRLRVRNQDLRKVVTTRSAARRVLADERVDVDRDDLVRVRRDGRRVTSPDKRSLRAGDTVRFVAVRTVRNKRHQSVKAPTRTRKVSHLRPGQRKVVAQGRAGVRTITIVRTRHNGRVVDVDRTKRITRAPKPRRVIVGRAARSVPGTAHLNWAGLARCESGGNPRAVNPAGYYGLYQFNLPTWGSVGGSGNPARASAEEQTFRAKLLYKQRGRQPWPHCGRYL